MDVAEGLIKIKEEIAFCYWLAMTEERNKKDHALAVGVVSDFPAIGYLQN